MTGHETLTLTLDVALPTARHWSWLGALGASALAVALWDRLLTVVELKAHDHQTHAKGPRGSTANGRPARRGCSCCGRPSGVCPRGCRSPAPSRAGLAPG